MNSDPMKAAIESAIDAAYARGRREALDEAAVERLKDDPILRMIVRRMGLVARQDALEEAARIADAAFVEHGSKHTNPHEWDSWKEGWSDAAAVIEERIRAAMENADG